LAEVLRTTTTLQKLAFRQETRIALQNDKVVDALAKNRSVKILEINARSCSYFDKDQDNEAITAALTKALAAVLKENSTIKEIDIDLHGNHIGGEGAAALAGLKVNSSLQTLNLTWNKIGDDGAVALAAGLKVNSSLQTLNLTWNKIGDEGAVALAEALKDNKSLQTLALCKNQIGDEGAKALAGALKVNSSVRHLNLRSNKISDSGAAALADALKDNKSLTKVELGSNQIGAEGARALAAALKVNSSLQAFDLDYNNISNVGAAAMTEALKENITLKKLYLGGNKIGETGGKAILNVLQESGNSSIDYIALYCNDVTSETLNKIDEEINRIQNSIRTVAIDGGQVVAEGLVGQPRGDDNERSSNETGQPTTTTIDAGNAYVGDASDEDAQINAERDEDIAAKETVTDTKEQELQSTITRLQRELVEKDEVIAQKDGEIASIKATLKKIGMIANGNDNDSNNEGGEAPQSKHRETESGDRNHLSQSEKELQSEIDSLREQLKNSRPIETVDLTTNEVEPSSATDDDSNEEEPPSKRQRTKSNLASALEQSQQMVAVKEEAIQRAATAEANAETARREKASVEASLRDVQEDLEIQQETTEQVAVTLDTWQGRFDRLYELAAASGVDGAVLRSIREGNNA
jgi:Ran GTPase-activating protein (RanGAP) involved in mRNA processing and transport